VAARSLKTRFGWSGVSTTAQDTTWGIH